MNTKIYLNNLDGTVYGVIKSIDINRVLDAGIIHHVDTFFTYSYKVHGENAFVFVASGPVCVVGDEEVAPEES